MALGKKCSSMKLRRAASMNGEDEFRLEFVRTRSFGRKRILISKNEEDSFCIDSSPQTPLKRHCSERFNLDEEAEKSPLENLPQELLIRIICGVDHEDLKQLSHVSQSFKEATKIAKKLHFAYSTPTKTNSLDLVQNPSEMDEIEVPNAPRQTRTYQSRLNGKNLAGLSVALFASPPKKALFVGE